MLGHAALSSSAISALAGAPNNLTSSLSVSVAASSTLTLTKNLSAAIDATNITAVVLNVDRLLQASLTVDATTTALIAVNKQLDQNLSVTATVASELQQVIALSASIQATNSTALVINIDHGLQSSIDVVATTVPNLTLENNSSAAVDVVVTVAPNLTLSNNAASSVTAIATVAPNLTLTQSIAASVSATATSTVALTVVVEQQASVTVIAAATGNLQQIIDIEASATGSSTATASLQVTVNLEGVLVSSVNTAPNLQQTIALAGDLSVLVEITVGTPVDSSVVVTVSAYPLLDVDGNTFGSPGGPSVEGFFPPTAVIFATHSESAPEATYTITADFDEDPDIITEILEVDFDDNPAEVLAYNIVNNQAFITARTPREVYAESSTFIVKRELEPILGQPMDYRVRFNTVVKQSRTGNNFYSTKFYNDQGYVCFLRDNGSGLIELFEETAPGMEMFLQSVGKINYDTGEVEVRQLNIRAKYDSVLMFTVESINNVIPTSDYFSLKNSTVVQSQTITFPSGEQVEISQYEKSTDEVVIQVYVRARSYNIATPEVTIEEREAVYLFAIQPDYSIGRDKLLQLIAEEV